MTGAALVAAIQAIPGWETLPAYVGATGEDYVEEITSAEASTYAAARVWLSGADTRDRYGPVILIKAGEVW